MSKSRLSVEKAYQEQSRDYTLSAGAANLYSVLIIIPVTVIYCLSYGWLWGWGKFGSDLAQISEYFIPAIVLLIIGTVLHELLHAAVWALAGSLSLRMFKFGFNLKALSPYAHCTTSMPIRAYRWGAAAPGLVLGFIPFFLALITGNTFLMNFGFIFTLAAGGDLLMLWMIRGVKPDMLVQDHPDRVGCEIVSPGLRQPIRK